MRRKLLLLEVVVCFLGEVIVINICMLEVETVKEIENMNACKVVVAVVEMVRVIVGMSISDEAVVINIHMVVVEIM